jgi:hypothetical protein
MGLKMLVSYSPAINCCGRGSKVLFQGKGDNVGTQVSRGSAEIHSAMHKAKENFVDLPHKYAIKTAIHYPA